MGKKHHKEVEESKQELLDEILRLRKERSDLQMLAGEVKERAVEVNFNLDKALDEIKKLHQWSGRVKEILQLSTMIEVQEEKDKSSISLIGAREAPLAKRNDPLATEKSVFSSTQQSIMQSELKKNQVVSIDSHCVNCHNNPEAADRQFILQQFKMACLQYKPSTISYKEKVYDRDDILRLKQIMI